MVAKVTATNLNEFGRFDDLKTSVDKAKAKEYFEQLENAPLPPAKINIRIHKLLQEFILAGGFEINDIFSSKSTQSGLNALI